MKMRIHNIKATFDLLGKRLEEVSQEEARRAVSKMTDELRNATPVDTGLAKSSWVTTEMPKKFYVENTTEYIQYLNEGSSNQAPPRFIESIALKYGKPLGIIVAVKD